MKYSLLILTLSFVLLFLYTIQQSTSNKACHIKSNKTCLQTTTRVINNKKCLSGVKDLPSDHGLLFKFPKADLHSFWMKDMSFPLDFIFYKDGREVDRLKDISPDTYPKIFTAKEEFDEAVEIKARR